MKVPAAKPFVLPLLFFCLVSSSLPAQVYPPDTSALRDYVGIVSQSFHPEINALLQKIREENADNRDYVKIIDQTMRGLLGSGFLLSVDLGNGEKNTYILTSYHVISGGWKLSITFVNRNGEKTVYNGLRFIAADREKDLALFALADLPEALPGLGFLGRPVQEGEDVYTAGFPGLAGESVWQLGRGAISNTEVTFPSEDDEDEDVVADEKDGQEKTIGPFIQHTAQTDPGNSGGPLLIYDPGAPAGFAVAGISTLSARWRQAANFAIPADTARVFVGEALGLNREPDAGKSPDSTVRHSARQELDKTVNSFLGIFERYEQGRYRYEKIADHLSLSCVGENAVRAYYETLDDTRDYRIYEIGSRPVDALRGAVSGLIQKSIPSKTFSPKITDTVEETDGAYTVTVVFDKKEITTRWIREYGQWRLDRFGDLDGDKSLAQKAEKRHEIRKNLRDEEYGFHADGGYVYIAGRGPAAFASLGRGETGVRLYYADESYWQFEAYMEMPLVPLRFSVFSLAVTLNVGAGFKKVPAVNDGDWGIRAGMSPQLGLQFTTAVISGLYIGAAYQFNWYFKDSADRGSDTHLFIFSAGYRFPR